MTLELRGLCPLLQVFDMPASLAPDVDGAYEHLRTHGIAVDKPTVVPYGMKQLYVKDPDGITLCFQSSAGIVAPKSASA
jgi:hypothetical protein